MSKVLYRAIDCTSGIEALLEGDLEPYIGSVITIEEEPTLCIQIIGVFEPEGEAESQLVTPVSCYTSCEDCLRTAYRLVDCSGRYDDKYTLEVSLSDHVGSIVRIPYFYDTCFQIEVVRYEPSQRYYQTLNFEGPYNSCDSCRKLEQVFPEQDYFGCNVEKIVDVKCTFAELMHQHIISKRFGVKFCCPIDKDRATIKNEIINIEIINHPDPELPEPYVEPCCIPTRSNCTMPIQNNCRTCEDSPTVEDEVNCNCEASVDSPHDCHTYSFEVAPEYIEQATGNTTTYLNGKVFFAYYMCKDTSVTTNVYTEPEEVENICVLGRPIFGYFNNNQWFELDLERGEICEEVELNNCCNG
jgi:hypothetical protein